MSVNYSKEDYWFMASRRLQAFQQIAEKLGKDHPITKMMGSRAWARHNFEAGPDGGLRGEVRAMSALDGAFDVLNTWARDNDQAAQRIMLELHPRGFENHPSKKKE
jgi:hypothetical protein